MSKNSFKDLEKMEMENLDSSIEQIKSNVDGSMTIFRFLGDLVELFIPNVFGIMTHLLDGEDSKTKDNIPDSRYPNLRGK